MTEPDIDYIIWLRNIVRSDSWNGQMRTPWQWRVLYDRGLTAMEAAVSTEMPKQSKR